MLKKSLLVLAVFMGCTFPVPAGTAATSSSIKATTTLKPTAAEDEACKYITQYLQHNHYRKVSVNDSLSTEIFNRYIDNLDASRSYFLASDIESLRKDYGTRMDDEFLAGQADAGFAIYNRFLGRAKEKMLFMGAAIETAHFNFAAPDTLALELKGQKWPSSAITLTDRWKKELKYQWLNLKYSGKSNKSIRSALIKSFRSRLNVLNHQKPDDAFQAYINALATSFDPHTSYFSPEEYENFQIDMSRSLEGIGAKLQTEAEYTVVNEVIPGGPAFKSNLLRKGDKIVGPRQG